VIEMGELKDGNGERHERRLGKVVSGLGIEPRVR